MLNQQSKAGIFGSGDSSSPSEATATVVGGGQHPGVAHHEGSSQGPHGTSHHHPLPGVLEVSQDHRVLPVASGDSGRSA
jgi:hypothetical protein